MEAILSIISGGIGGAILTWLFRNWITERLKQSIQHEYSQKLETHKAELNADMQSILHERQLYSLRTSLFFDHQRKAFAQISNQLAITKDKWFNVAFDPEEPFEEPVPYEEFKTLKSLFYEHQLFFDSDCLLAIDLALKAMQDSFPFKDEFGDPEQKRECREPYERLGYIQERMIQIFQEKIGISPATIPKEELALLALINILNSYHFSSIGLPVKGTLKLEAFDQASDAVSKARNNKQSLVSKSEELQKYLRNKSSFDEALTIVNRALKILK